MEEEVPPVVEEKPVTVAAEAAEKQYYAVSWRFTDNLWKINIVHESGI